MGEAKRNGMCLTITIQSTHDRWETRFSTGIFWYHHTPADTMDKIDPHEIGLCVATMAVMAYVVADMEVRLPR